MGSPGGGAADRPRRIAIVGAGPSGIYAAEALAQQAETPVEVTVLDRLPTPFGLVRYGVAPDHPSIRLIRNTLERTLDSPAVSFVGNVEIGRDLTIDELRRHVDAVIYAYGAATSRLLDIPGHELPGAIGAADLVAWYCGHPDVHPGEASATDRASLPSLVETTRRAVIIGAGNVALDVARILIKDGADLTTTDMADPVLASLARKDVEEVHLVHRRGPGETSFTTKEVRELGGLPDVEIAFHPDPLDLPAVLDRVRASDKVAARNVTEFLAWQAKRPGAARKRVHLHFWTVPVALLGSDRVTGVRLATAPPGGVPAEHEVAADLFVTSIGYLGQPLPGVPFDDETGRVPHVDGRVLRDGAFSPGEYVAGWIKRGPTGVIGTNKHDAVETVGALLHDLAEDDPPAPPDPRPLTALLADKGLHPLDMAAWHRIDATEAALGQAQGRDRATIAARADLIAAADEDAPPG